MGVAVEEGVEVEVCCVLGIVLVSVSEQEALAFVDHEGIVGHDGEVEQHLVNLAIAIATDGDDAVGKGIELLSHGLRIVTLGDGVARAEIEEVAKEQEHVALLSVEVGDDLVKRCLGAVNVGGYEVFHEGSEVLKVLRF